MNSNPFSQLNASGSKAYPHVEDRKQKQRARSPSSSPPPENFEQDRPEAQKMPESRQSAYSGQSRFEKDEQKNCVSGFSETRHRLNAARNRSRGIQSQNSMTSVSSTMAGSVLPMPQHIAPLRGGSSRPENRKPLGDNSRENSSEGNSVRSVTRVKLGNTVYFADLGYAEEEGQSRPKK